MLTLNVERAIGSLAAAIDEEVSAAMIRGAEKVASDAAARHTFVNRSGLLQASIVPGVPKGSAVRGRVRIDVIADTPYASYVEDGTHKEDGSVLMEARPYLAPALERCEADVLAEVERGLETAFARVWGGA